MSRRGNIDAIVEEFPFGQEPTQQAITNLRKFLEEQEPRRLKKMRRQLEEFLKKRGDPP